MTSATEHSKPGGFGFWLAVVIGVGVMAFGVMGLLHAAPATRPLQVLRDGIGLDLVHDLVLAPIACGAGILLTRLLPPPWRAPVRAALFATVMVLLVSWPALRGYGRAIVPDNPTVDPLNYSTAVLTVVALVWLAAAGWGIVASWLARRHAASSSRFHPTGRQDIVT